MAKKIPEPNYDRDIKRLVKVYEQAVSDINAQLADIADDPLKEVLVSARLREIERILRELNAKALPMSELLMEQAVRDGAANTLYALGITKSISEAKRVYNFTGINRAMLETIIADMQSDLLAITQLTERKTKQAVRKAVMEAMQEQFAIGAGRTRDVKRNVLKRLATESNVAIVDSASRKWKLETYVEMAVNTKMMNAHRDATANEGVERGAMYGRISSHGAKDACSGYEGRVVALSPDASTAEYEYYGRLPRSKIFHPYCKHIITAIRDPKLFE